MRFLWMISEIFCVVFTLICFCSMLESAVFDFQTRDDGDAHDAEMTAARWIAMFHVASCVTVACAAWC